MPAPNGTSPAVFPTDAWQQGMRILGAEASAVAIAIILAKKQEIRSKGGYFRGMVRAAQRGDLNLGPTVYAIHDQLRAQRDGGERIFYEEMNTAFFSATLKRLNDSL